MVVTSAWQVYYTMYHLLHAVFDANDFAVNMDIAGVWGILGPLGTPTTPHNRCMFV